MNAVDELGLTTRAMYLMTEEMRVRGQRVEDRKDLELVTLSYKVLSKLFKEYLDTHEPAYKY